MRNNFFIVAILILSGLLGFAVSMHLHKALPTSQEQARLPTYHYPPLFLQQIAHAPDAGNKIFHEYCSSCHSRQPIIQVKAPRLGDKNICHVLHQKNRWQLKQIVLSGKGAMPARGGCFECSDAQLFLTLNYFLQESCK